MVFVADERAVQPCADGEWVDSGQICRNLPRIAQGNLGSAIAET
jgi:hypothetical protein